jgi:hypothetical protein
VGACLSELGYRTDLDGNQILISAPGVSMQSSTSSLNVATGCAAVILLSASCACGLAAEPKPKPLSEVSAQELDAFRSRLLAATAKHLDSLLDSQGKVVDLKGKSVDGATAMAFYQLYEATSNPKYRTAALELAERIVKDMKATRHGVLYIKEKEKGAETIAGGGPPAFGWYTAAAAYIFHKEGGKGDDIRYLAEVIDKYPWNAEGWWANTIDIKSGEPKDPLTKAGAINKSAAMAMCAGIASVAVQPLDAELARRLKAKAETCIYKQILPAQEADGFWHYGFKGTDPKNKDVLGYFMVTTHTLIQLQHCTDSYRDAKFQGALDKAYVFAAKTIVPMTDPNTGLSKPSERATDGTPAHYKLADDTKRGFQLGCILFAAQNHADGIPVMDSALKHFRSGNAGTEGAHAVGPAALALSILAPKGSEAKPK